MAETEIRSRLNNFFEDKNISNPFIRECIEEFVEGHSSLFGDIVSSDALLDRLEKNLDKVTFTGEYTRRAIWGI